MLKKRGFQIILILLLAIVLLSVLTPAMAREQTLTVSVVNYPVAENGTYSAMEEVAVYLSVYQRLPSNFITKKEARSMGWDNRAGNLGEVAPGCSIGGDHFGNYEGGLPEADGRKWKECDIEYGGGFRGGKRILFSNDGLIYYSDDHYNTFRQVKVVEGKTARKEDPEFTVKEGGEYTGKEEVAAYVRQYGRLPSNYLTKAEARELGWSSQKNNLGKVAPGFAIGGDSFQNREGLLPSAKGRAWYECDVNTVNGNRGKERVVFSNDGLIYYTPDNHKSFQKLY